MDNKTWVHLVTLKTKVASMTWKHLSLRKLNFEIQYFVKKLIATIFLDVNGTLLMLKYLNFSYINHLNHKFNYFPCIQNKTKNKTKHKKQNKKQKNYFFLTVLEMRLYRRILRIL